MADVVPLTVVPTQAESDIICALLQSEGIECNERGFLPANVGGGAIYGGPREILVWEDDLPRARALVASAGSLGQ